MPKVVEVTVPAEEVDKLVPEIQAIDGLMGLQVQRGVSIQPPGDVLTMTIANRSVHKLMHLLHERQLAGSRGVSIQTSQPTSIVSQNEKQAIVRDSSETTWEEMEAVVGKESNMTFDTMAIMAISGILAVVGMANSALHLVIAAAIIAPGFEPIVRISLGIASSSLAWKRGLVDLLKGYLALAVGAAAATLFFFLIGSDPLGDNATYLPESTLIRYWSQLTTESLLVGMAAAAAGAILVATNRSVLTSGVMLALALIPAAALASMGLVAGDLTLAAQGLLRWVVDVFIIIAVSLGVYAWQRRQVFRREMWL